MAQEQSASPVAAIVLPALLESFPPDAEGDQLLVLDAGFLPAAAKFIEREQATEIAKKRLADSALSPMQRISRLVLSLSVVI